MKYMGLDIVPDRDLLFDDLGMRRLRESYMLDTEDSPQQRFAFVAKTFGSNLEHSQRIYEYLSKHWLSAATPVLSYGKSNRGLPVSCYLPWIEDSAKGLVDALAETNWLSMMGGGVGIGFGIRSADEKSTGIMPHLKIYDASSLAYRQGKCYAPNTEVMTSKGWKKFEDISLSDKLAVITKEGKLFFDHPEDIITEYHSGKMIRFFNAYQKIDFSVTDDHSMVIKRKSRNNGWRDVLETVSASNMPQHNEASILISSTGTLFDGVSYLTPIEKFNIAFQADGHNQQSGCSFHFSKNRKIIEMESILNECGFSHRKVETTDNTTKFYIHAPIKGQKDFDWIDLENLSTNKAKLILKEISKWDSHIGDNGSLTFVTNDKSVAEKVQQISFIAGKFASIFESQKEGNRKLQYQLYIHEKTQLLTENLEREEYQYEGNVYCATVSTGMLVIKGGNLPVICGNSRRGSYAAYLDISHPDIILFLEMRKATGDQNFRCLNMHHGVNIPDSFMNIIENCMIDPNYDDSWELKDPNSAVVKEVVSAKMLWQKILELRAHTGEPYLHFIDTSNRFLPQWLKDKGLKIRQSNLCTEIVLPTDENRTAVCCLSSFNLEYFDEWSKDEQFLDDCAEFIDNVLQCFIDNAPDEIHRARYSAQQSRDVGLGALGFHAFLQKNMIPFEGAMAKVWNKKIFKHIKTNLEIANFRLGKERGEAPDAVGTGRRFSLMMAIAPNASSSIIMRNTSPSIEPYRANAYRQDTLSGAFMNKNRFLDSLIKEYCEKDQSLKYDKIWSSIISNDGSVQQLKFLTDDEKLVFKTAMEIDQRWIIEHAADRQEFIDQAQSVNIFVRPNVNIMYLHLVHFNAWKLGLKSLYYCRSEKIGKSDKIANKIERKVIKEMDIQSIIEGETCLACEG